MKFILGTKLNMTEVFDIKGEVHPVTILKAPAVTVTQVKNKETDGYSALQVGFGEKKENRINKPMKGHSKNLGNFSSFKEIRTEGENEKSTLNVGDKIDLSSFKEGDMVSVSAISKGKGFQGVVKRHGFKGGSRTHGQKHSEREPGAIGGAGRAGGRVAKGMRMAGRMGGERITVKNLKVIQVIPTENIMLVEGAVPGRRGTVVEIRG